MKMTKMNSAFTQLLKERTQPGQFKAITADAPLVAVSAGAGTGKTWTLAWRFIWILVTGRADTNEILTLTFTEKAALEMAERIKNLLLQLAMELPSQKVFFQKAADRIDEGYISTIHSFSMRVLKECGLATELDPESGTIAPPQESLFWKEAEEALDRWDGNWFAKSSSHLWAQRIAKLFSDPLFMDSVNTFGPNATVELAKSSLALFASQGQTPEDLWQWGSDLFSRDQDAVDTARLTLFRRWEDEWHRFLQPESGIFYNLNELGGTGKLCGNVRNLITRWQQQPSKENLPHFIQSLIEGLKGASGKLANEIAFHLKEPVSQYRNRLIKEEPWITVFTQGFDEKEQAYRSCLLGFSAILWQLWDEFRRRKNRLSFDDMIRYAMEALEHSPSYAERFKEILVDEFQDTNPLQDRLIQAVRSHSQRLFIVGDLKQSIYRFRHADLSLFGSYIKKAKYGHGDYILLDTSFRSKEILVHEVNDLFSSVWKDGLGQELPLPFESLEVPHYLSTHELRQQCTVDPFLTYLEGGKEGEKIREARLRQIRRLALLFSQYYEEKRTVWDKQKECLRPVQWKDMAILVPSRTSWFPLLEKIFFEEFQLPIYFEGSTSYFSRSEIQDLIALLNFLDDPGKELYLMSFLSSPLSSLSLEEVRDLALDAPKGYRLQAFQEKWPHLARQIDDWRLMAHFLGPSAVLASFLEKSDSFLRAFPAWKRRGVAANMRKAIDMAREFEEAIGTSLPGCASYLREAMERQEKFAEPDVSNEKENVIRVMTVHGSKGLEFPVLAVLGLERTSSAGEKGSLMPSPKMGVALSRIPGERNSGQAPLAWSLSRLFEEQEEYEEWQRLFYVACTRARDSLILCGHLPWRRDGYSPGDRSWLKMLLSWNPELLPLTDEPAAKAGGPKEERERSHKYSSVPLPSSEHQYLARISATSFALFQYCPYAYRMKHRQGHELVWEQPGEYPSEGGADVGSLVHYLLSQWDFASKPLESFFPEEENWDTFTETLPGKLRAVWKRPRVPSHIYSWLLTFQQGAIVGRILKNNLTVKKEVPFRADLVNGPTMVGAIDLLWHENDMLFIRDFKITTISQVPENLYRDQLAFYALAMKKTLSVPRISLGFWHLREGTEELLSSLEREDWDQIEGEVRKMARQALSGPFKPVKGRCSFCPFKGECTWLHA